MFGDLDFFGGERVGYIKVETSLSCQQRFLHLFGNSVFMLLPHCCSSRILSSELYGTVLNNHKSNAGGL